MKVSISYLSIYLRSYNLYIYTFVLNKVFIFIYFVHGYICLWKYERTNEAY